MKLRSVYTVPDAARHQTALARFTAWYSGLWPMTCPAGCAI
mgnify:CR=1 FL=1